MFQKLAESVGNILLNQVAGNADLVAGQAGEGPLDTGSTGEMFLSAETAKIMKPVYDMAAQLKDHEARRIRESMFGISPDTQAVNPVAKGVSEFLAGRMYNQKISPFISSLEKEIKETHKGQVDAKGDWNKNYDSFVTQLMGSPDPQMSTYGDYLASLKKRPDPKKTAEIQEAMNKLITSWKTQNTPENAARLAILNKIKPFNYTAVAVTSPEEMKKRATDTFRKYLTAMNYAVTPANKVLGIAKRDQNELVAREADRISDAISM